MWRRQSDSEPLDVYRAKTLLRQLELRAYSSLVSALMVQGDLIESRKSFLERVRKQLHISHERHRAEIRRCLCDTSVKRAAELLRGGESCLLWNLESRQEVPTTPAVLPQAAVVTATRHIVAAAVAGREVSAYDLARYSTPRHQSAVGHRSVFSLQPQERLTVGDLSTGLTPKPAAPSNKGRCEVISQAIKVLCNALDPAENSGKALATVSESAVSSDVVTDGTVNSSSAVSAAPTTPTTVTPPQSQSAIAVTPTAANQLCRLVSQLIAYESRPVDRVQSPIETRGESSATGVSVPQTASASRIIPSAPASTGSEDYSVEKKPPRRKPGRPRLSKPSEDKPNKLASVVAAGNGSVACTASPMKPPPGTRKPRTTADGSRPKQRRRPKNQAAEVAVPIESKPLMLPSVIATSAPLAPLPQPPRDNLSEGIGTLDLLAGMALEQKAALRDATATMDKGNYAFDAIPGVGNTSQMIPTVSSATPTPPLTTTNMSLPLLSSTAVTPVIAAVPAILSPAMASALPSSAWLTNAVSAVVSQASLLPGASSAGSQAPISSAASGITTSTLPTCASSITAPPSSRGAAQFQTTGAGATSALYSLAATAIANRSPASLSSSSTLLPLSQQIHGSGTGTDALQHVSPFSSVTYQSESLAQLGIIPTSLTATAIRNSMASAVTMETNSMQTTNSVSSVSPTSSLSMTVASIAKAISETSARVAGHQSPSFSAHIPNGSRSVAAASQTAVTLASLHSGSAVTGAGSSSLHQFPVSVPSNGPSSLLLPQNLLLQSNFPEGEPFVVSSDDDEHGTLKQVSNLVAELSGSSEEVTAILQKAENQYEQVVPSGGDGILDGIALPDDHQLADFIRLCQEGRDTDEDKIEPVSPSDLVTVLSAVGSPTSTPNTAVTPLEQMMVAEAAMLGGGVDTVLSGIESLPTCVAELVGVDVNVSVSAAPLLGVSTSLCSSPAPAISTSTQPGHMLSASAPEANVDAVADAVVAAERMPNENGLLSMSASDADVIVSEVIQEDMTASEDHPSSILHQDGQVTTQEAIMIPSVAAELSSDCTSLDMQLGSTVEVACPSTSDSSSESSPEHAVMQPSLTSPTSLASGRRKRRSSTSDEDSWEKAALQLMQRLSKFRGSDRPKNQMGAAAWFLHPVNPKKAPGYLDVVKNPMDFGTIKKKLEQYKYSIHTEWLSDMYLVRSNCHLYNSPEHLAVKDCEEVFGYFEVEFEKMKDQWEAVRSPAKKPKLGPLSS